MCARIATTLASIASLAAASAALAGGTVWFVVAEREGNVQHGDSYVLPLEDPEHIAHARDLVEHGPSIGRDIAVARIRAGADGVNRDVLAEGEPLWSWRVTELVDFVDTTAEILDGWPGLVEDDVEWWIENTNSRVGFWSYTVTAELGPQEPADLNGDGEVGGADLGILIADWNETASPADLDGSGRVGSGDLGILLGAWG